MIYEVRGSMIVYLALGTTSAFTPGARRATFIVLTTYAFFYGDFLGDVPFYIGALLADMALCLKNSSLSQPSLSSRTIGPYRLISIVKSYWPIALAIFALFIGSYPPDSPDRATWSNFLYRMAYSVNPAAGINLLHFRLTN
jgi:hypothetical protein